MVSLAPLSNLQGNTKAWCLLQSMLNTRTSQVEESIGFEHEPVAISVVFQ